MPQPTYLPTEVLDSIRNHVRTIIDNNIEDFFASAAETEEGMTGQLFGALQTRNVAVRVENSEVRGVWRWSLAYTNFRSSGPNATEDALGADGIVELHINDYGDRRVKKCALFQAKMYGKGGKPLLRQCLKLSRWREAAFVINYEPEAVTALFIDDVIAARGLPSKEKRIDFAAFFAHEFAACNLGDRELFYDAAHRRLYWRTMNKEMVAAQFSIPYRLRLKVRVPPHRAHPIPKVHRILTPTQIDANRMLAEPQDILQVPSFASLDTVEAAFRKQTQKYHPDHLHDLDREYWEIANERMREIINAHDAMKARHLAKR